MGRTTGLIAGALTALVATGCAVADGDVERTQLEPLHGTVDPEALVAPMALPVAAPESSVAVGQWRVAEVVDGATLVLYRGLERATAVLGNIVVPTGDDCLSAIATDSLAFITGGGQAVAVRPPTPRQGLIDDAEIMTADGDDVAAAMLSLGLARVDDDVRTPSEYLEVESVAREQKVGLWSDVCDG